MRRYADLAAGKEKPEKAEKRAASRARSTAA
jgi:hypothetical protein